MGLSLEERIAGLESKLEAVAPTDNMAEAGRKVLLAELIRMLKHEAGSRTGEDIEDVHDMRVADSPDAQRLSPVAPYYKVKEVRPFGVICRGWVRC